MNEIQFFSPNSVHDYEETAQIFREYETYLGVDLCFQSFEEELKNLSKVYEKPKGTIILAKVGAEIAGCIALKPIELVNCEMKRLYVKPKFRGLRIGRKLVEMVIDFAKTKQYHKMKLDTLVQLKEAIHLYQSFGFKTTEAYVYNPLSEVLYFEKDLTNA
ncbi:MAG: GNAT family N-acetyltransferase [Bacteroidota bacterium]